MNGNVRSIGAQSIRYIIFGGANTLLSFSAFVGLGLVVEPKLAYSISFLASLVAVSLLSNRWIFHGLKNWRAKLYYTMWYLIIFSSGQLIIGIVNPVELGDLVRVSGMILLVSVPLSFLGGRVIFKTREKAGNHVHLVNNED